MSELISVQDALPEVGVSVLMRVTCGDSFYYEQGKYKGGGEWVNCWCSVRNKDLYPVTHWQPLPEPPLSSFEK